MKNELKSARIGCIVAGAVLFAALCMMIADNFAMDAVFLFAGMLAIFAANLMLYRAQKKKQNRHKR